MSEIEDDQAENKEKKLKRKLGKLLVVCCLLLVACCLLFSSDSGRMWICKTGISVLSTGDFCFGITLKIEGY